MIEWPTAFAVRKTVEKFKVDISDYIGMTLLFPFETTDEQEVRYFIEMVKGGMISAHSLDSDVKIIGKDGAEEIKWKPFYFREAKRWNESDILKLAELDHKHRRMRINRMVGKEIAKQKPRVIKRIEWSVWKAILTGKVTVKENNVNITADYGVPTANITKTPSITWDNADTAKGIADLIKAKRTYFKGTGKKLGKVIMNPDTLQLLCDMKDTWTKYKGSTVKEAWTSDTAIRLLKMLITNVDFLIYEGEYDDEAGNVHEHLPFGKIVFWPKAEKGEIGNWTSTPSVLNGGINNPQPGIYGFTEDKTKKSNPHFDLGIGVHGAPMYLRPDCVFVMDVLPKT